MLSSLISTLPVFENKQYCQTAIWGAFECSLGKWGVSEGKKGLRNTALKCSSSTQIQKWWSFHCHSEAEEQAK